MCMMFGMCFEENVFLTSSHGTVAVSGGMGMMCGWQHDVTVASNNLEQGSDEVAMTWKWDCQYKILLMEIQ